MSGNHFSRYKDFSSYELIKEIYHWCNCMYLNSIQFAAGREILKSRMRFLNNFKRSNSTEIIENKTEVAEILIQDYKLYCKYECNDMPAVIDVNNRHMRAFFKRLHKKLSSALNKFDKNWGYRGVWGYGTDYGICHCEQDHQAIKNSRNLRKAVECLRKIALETNNEACIQTLKDLGIKRRYK